MTFPSREGIPLTEAQFAESWAWFAFHKDGQSGQIPKTIQHAPSKGPYVSRVISAIAAGHSQKEVAQIVGCTSGCVSQIVSREKLKVKKRSGGSAPGEAIAANTEAVLALHEKGRTQREIVDALDCTRYTVERIIWLEKNGKK